MREAAEAGIDVPDLALEDQEEESDEQLGGFAFEMCFLAFRMRPAPHLVGDALEGFFETELKPKEDRLREIFDGRGSLTPGDELAFRRAWEVFHQHERYGLPREGGYLDQPMEWIFVANCVLTAKERAESLNEREEAWFNRQKAEQAREDAPSADVSSGV